jgi:hypothetical protein
MSSIALSNPISLAITLAGTTRINYLDGLETHFSRAGSTIDVFRHSSGNTLYMWPNADPTRWIYALTTTNSPVGANGLTGFLDWGVDYSSVSLPEDPTTPGGLSANRTPALTQHVQNVTHTKFIVHEYGDALFIQELVSGNTSFTRHYHLGEIFAPAWVNAPSLGIKGLGILGGTGNIVQTTSADAWMMSGTSNIASRIQFKLGTASGVTLWLKPQSYYTMSQTTAVSSVEFASALSPVVCLGNDASITTSTVSNYLNLGFYKYLARFHTLRPPGALLESSVDQTAYVAINVATGDTSHFARCQYGVSGIL